MAENSTIEWCEATWNPIAGCSITSPGCHNCYAMRMAARLEAMGQAKYAGTTKPGPHGPLWTGVINTDEDALSIPLHWKKPRRIFVNSMSDLFHKNVPVEVVDRVFAVMALCPQHTFQVLTKRADRASKYTESAGRRMMDAIGMLLTEKFHGRLKFKEPDRHWPWSKGLCGTSTNPPWPLPQVWIGASVEDRKRRSRIDDVRQATAEIRFLSIEPLLEDIGALDLTGIDWAIVGTESGPNRRPTKLDCVRGILRQCAAAGVACFIKQLEINGRVSHDMDEWPADLRVREYPTTKAVAR